MKQIALVSVLALLAAGTAQAGGPVRPVAEPAVAPAPAPVGSWQGAYVGGSLVRGDGTVEAAGEDGDTLDALGVDRTYGDLEGFGGAVRAGYDRQFGKVVVGLGGSFDFGGYDDARRDEIVFDSTISNIGTVFLRAGYDMGRWMPYILAGYSWAESDFSTGGVDASPNLDGYTLGLGGEYRLAARWAGFAEIGYTDFGDLEGSGGEIEADLSRVNLGLAYRF